MCFSEHTLICRRLSLHEDRNVFMEVLASVSSRYLMYLNVTLCIFQRRMMLFFIEVTAVLSPCVGSGA